MKVLRCETSTKKFRLLWTKERGRGENTCNVRHNTHVNIVSSGLVVTANNTLALPHVLNNRTDMLLGNITSHEPATTTKEVVKAVVEGTEHLLNSR